MRNRWQTWRPPQDPGQSLGFLHSPRLVLATTFGCPNGQQHANLSSFLIISDTVAVSPRLHSSSSVRNAPWLAQMNFSISDSITHTHTAGRAAATTDWICLKAVGIRCWYRFWSLETETKLFLLKGQSRTANFAHTRAASCSKNSLHNPHAHTQPTEKWEELSGTRITFRAVKYIRNTKKFVVQKQDK